MTKSIYKKGQEQLLTLLDVGLNAPRAPDFVFHDGWGSTSFELKFWIAEGVFFSGENKAYIMDYREWYKNINRLMYDDGQRWHVFKSEVQDMYNNWLKNKEIDDLLLGVE